jgi:hypothetical protein
MANEDKAKHIAKCIADRKGYSKLPRGDIKLVNALLYRQFFELVVILLFREPG